MATKAHLAKAYDAGQAAQRDNVPDEACPFEDGPERDAYFEGKHAPLADKWLTAARRLTQEIDS